MPRVYLKSTNDQMDKMDASQILKLSNNVDDFLSKMVCTHKEIDDMEIATRGQDANPKWHAIRRFRITSTNFHSILVSSNTEQWWSV